MRTFTESRLTCPTLDIDEFCRFNDEEVLFATVESDANFSTTGTLSRFWDSFIPSEFVVPIISEISSATDFLRPGCNNPPSACLE